MTALLLALALAAEPASEAGRLADDGPRFAVSVLEARRSVVVVQFAAGWLDDGATPGLTRYAQRALLEANRAWPFEAQAFALRSADARLETTIGPATCEYRLSGDEAAVQALTPKLLAALFAPKLDDPQLKVVPRRGEFLDLPAPGLRAFEGQLVRALWGPPPRPFSKPIGLPAVKKTLKTLFAPANALVVTAGAPARAWVEGLVGEYKGGAASERSAAPLQTVEASRKGSIGFSARGTTFAGTSPAVAATAQLAATLLELKADAKLKAGGRSGGPEGLVVARPGIQALLVVVRGQDQPKPQSDQLLLGALDELRAGKVDDAEFGRGKQLAMRRLEAGWRDPQWWADALVASRGAPPASVADVRAALDALKKEDFAAGVKPLLAKERSVAVTQKLPTELKSATMVVLPTEAL